MTWERKIQKKLAWNSAPVEKSIFLKQRGSQRDDGTNDALPTGISKGHGFNLLNLKTYPDSPSPVQAKLTVGAPGDKYEQEADAMAAQVMSMPEPATSVPVQREMTPEEQEEELQTKPLADSITPLVQREIASEEEEVVQTKPALQRAEDGSFDASSSLESRLSSSKGGGSPLPDNVQGFMEPRFGNKFDNVRVHTGDEAVQMNQELGAQAFTHGSDIYFGAGKAPENNELMAHELTHVVQQVDQKKNFLSTEKAAIQKFDPCYHKQAVVDSASSAGFSPEEVGQIYAANWERDFSQAPPAFANIVLAWKSLKLELSKRTLTEYDIANFGSKIDKLVKTMLATRFNLLGEPYGGYKYYEHMDNPVKFLKKEEEGTRSLPQYIVTSRTYIKQQLFESAEAYRNNNAQSKGGDTVVIAAETAQQAREKQRKQGLPKEKSSVGRWNSTVADRLGRASHALEDFFSHSNFVELAIGEAAPVVTGVDEKSGAKQLSTKEIGTGTFGSFDKIHSVSHKLQALAAEIEVSFPILRQDARELRFAAEHLESLSREMAEPGSHTLLAKDQPGHENTSFSTLKTIKFQMAQEIATAADQEIFGLIRQVFDANSPEASNALMQIVYVNVDALISPPEGHPLSYIIDRRRAQAVKALQDNKPANNHGDGGYGGGPGSY